jgi:transmembrane sensor
MNHQTADTDWTALARYLAGESGPEEAAALERWIAADPQRGELLRALSPTAPGQGGLPPVDLEAALRRVKTRFEEPALLPLPQRRWLAVAFPIAAAATLLVGASLLWITLRAGHSALLPAASYVTAAGKTTELRLPDSTEVTLGPGSRLTVSAGYGSPDRRVELEGQALFGVQHRPDHPFSVRVGAVEIRDLGTRFSVHSDREAVRVSVLSGSVLLVDTVPRAGRSLPLKAGESGMLAREQQRPAQRTAASPEELAWTRGRLVFDNASLARVRDDLHRWYGLTLVIADSALLNRHLTAAFSGESPAQVLDVIALALGARIERRGDTAFVRARSPKPAP